MPETKEPVTEVATQMASDLKAKTDAAVGAIKGGGFDDPEFASGLQAAIDKDLGKAPPEEKKDPEPAKVKEVAPPTEKKEAIVDDIPGELLGEKPKEEKKSEQSTDEAAKAEAERLKSIEEQTKGMTPKAAERFKKIEARAHEAEQRAKKIADEMQAEKAALQKQIQDIAMKAAVAKPDNTEIENLKKQLEERDAIISKAALQEDPRFKAAFDGKIATEIEKVKKIVPSENAEELAELLRIPESKKRNERIQEIAADLDDITKVKVLASLERVDGLASEKADQLSKWRENKIHVEAAALREREQNRAKIQEIQQVAWAKGMAAVSAPETGLEVFRKAAGNDDWNSRVDARQEAVQKMLASELQPEQLVEIAARSVAAEEYRRMFLAQRILVKRLSDELLELKKAEPEPGNVGAGSASGPQDKDDFVTAAIKGSLRDGGLQR